MVDCILMSMLLGTGTACISIIIFILTGLNVKWKASCVIVTTECSTYNSSADANYFFIDG